ncbi:MAG: double-strand break repair helicase AddA [Geminicoccaceae bacterium]|nr:MAG: double-strand break repair helicase AddA [Geminicoccaceae bacterium]
MAGRGGAAVSERPVPKPPTPEQRRASDPRHSVWVDANAGTGKTRVLAERVLRLLLQGAPPASVLCLTFTKAAAGEMAERVMQRLAAWAAMDEAGLALELRALDGEAVTPRRLAKARSLHDAVLALPAGLAIMTVHGLCQFLLKRFPVEAAVAPSFDVIDERTAAELLQLARDAVLAQAHDDAARAQDVAQLVAGAADTTLLAALDAMIAARLNWIAARDRAGGLDAALAALARVLGVDPNARLDAVLDAALADAAMDVAGLRRVASFLAGANTATRSRAGRAIAGWLDLPVPARRQGLDLYRQSFATFDATTEPPGWRLNGRLVNAKLQREAPEVVAVLAAEVARLEALDAAVRARRLFDRTAALWRLADAVLVQFEAAKRQRAALDFDDLLLRTAELLARPDFGAWVRFKLDQAFTHILVDEAQDTNPLQWQIVEALVDDLHAGAGTRAPGERTLFVVGDAKQSIYRFQGADPAATEQVRQRLAAMAAAAGLPLARIGLSTSFRSSQAVLDVVDALLQAEDAVAVHGVSAPHRAFRTTSAGRVELWPLVPAGDGPDRPDPWAVPPDLRAEDPAERRLAQRIAATVADWLRQGERLAASGRPLRAGDVMVLLRRREPLQEVLVRAFKRAGVPVLGADRLALTSHLAVQDLMALAEAVLLPDDDFALACMLKSPLFELTEDELFHLAHGRAPGERLIVRWRQRAQGCARLAALLQRFEAWQRLADFVPPYEWFLRVLGGAVAPHTGFEARRAMLRRFGAEAGDVLDAFVDQALAYERGHAATLQGFLHWLGLGDESLKREGAAGIDGVRVMTVHGAKGLEAPVVFLADAGPRGDANRGTLLWLPDPALPLWRPAKAVAVTASLQALAAEDAARQGDDLRLLYVAATRAAERLIVCGWSPKRVPRAASWHDRVSTALASLPATRTEGDVLVYATGVPAAVDSAVPPPPAPPPLPAHLRQPAPPPKRVRSLTPSAAEAQGTNAVGADRRAALAFGRHVHRLLEHLPTADAADRNRVLEAYLAHHATDLDAAARRHLGDQVRRLLAEPDLAPLFGPLALAEQPIVGRLGDVLVAGQIDRLWVGQGEVRLVDFKTGRPPAPGAPPPAHHLRQLALYAALLARVHPGASIRAGLVWTATARVTWLDMAALQPHLPDGVGIAEAAAIA